MIPFRCLSKKITWSKCLIAPGYAMGIRAVNSQERSRKPLTVPVPVFFFVGNGNGNQKGRWETEDDSRDRRPKIGKQSGIPM